MAQEERLMQSLEIRSKLKGKKKQEKRFDIAYTIVPF